MPAGFSRMPPFCSAAAGAETYYGPAMKIDGYSLCITEFPVQNFQSPFRIRQGNTENDSG